MMIMGFTIEALKNLQFRALCRRNLRTISILPDSHELINLMDIQNTNSVRLGYQSEISGQF